MPPPEGGLVPPSTRRRSASDDRRKHGARDRVLDHTRVRGLGLVRAPIPPPAGGFSTTPGSFPEIGVPWLIPLGSFRAVPRFCCVPAST